MQSVSFGLTATTVHFAMVIVAKGICAENHFIVDQFTNFSVTVQTYGSFFFKDHIGQCISRHYEGTFVFLGTHIEPEGGVAFHGFTISGK